MNKEHQIVAEEIKKLLELLPVIGTLERQLESNATNLEFMAESTFLTRKSTEILKTVEKQLKQLEEKVAAQACLVFAQLSLKNYKTENCTISPNASFYIKYPSSPNEEGYEQFVKQLPIDCIRPHYPTIGEKIVEAAETGNPMPFGLDREEIRGVEPKLRLTAKKEL